MMKNIKKAMRKVTHTFAGYKIKVMQLGWYIVGDLHAAHKSVITTVDVAKQPP